MLMIQEHPQEPPFDFTSVPEEKRQRALALDTQLGIAIQQLNYTVNEIGIICTEMKALLPHGYFGSWHESRGLTHNQVEYAMNKVIGHTRFSTPIEEVSNNHENQDFELSTPQVETLATKVERGEIPIREALKRVQYNPSITYITGSMGSDYNDKYNTPPHIVRAVEDCLDGIDLDPCTNSKTEPNIPAKHLYDEEDDGLTQTWKGKVYMNSPYGNVIELWVQKLLAEYHAGNVTEAIALVPGRLDTNWFQSLYDFTLCIIKGRLTFGNSEYNAPFPSVLVYLGERPWEFARVFGKLGRLIARAHEVELMSAIVASWEEK